MKHTDAGRFRRSVRALSGTKLVSSFLSYTLHHADRRVFRLTKGHHTASSLLTGLHIIMLTTTGAKSGKRRTLPLLGIPDGEDIIVVASGYGQTRYPAWYHNLRKNPEATVEIAGERRKVMAREADSDERVRLWRLCLEVYPAFAAYEERTADRRIPVVVLTRE
jgi:deazaflavin-dependent oxidoreductase (nitroreductase family)